MDNSPIDYLKDTTDDGITLIDSSESFDMQDSLKEYILDRLSKNRGKDIVLKELESDYLKIAIKTFSIFDFSVIGIKTIFIQLCNLYSSILVCRTSIY